MATWTAVVTAAPTPGTRTITFIDGPANPPIGTKLRLETIGDPVTNTDFWPMFCPNCATAFHEDGTFTPPTHPLPSPTMTDPSTPQPDPNQPQPEPTPPLEPDVPDNE